MKLFIVCSKHFYKEIPPIASDLERFDHVISLSNSFHVPLQKERKKEMGLEKHVQWKAAMMRKDPINIAPRDGILVLNFEKNGQKNYIGGAIFLEMYTTWGMKKKIFLYNPIPDCIFTNELVGLNPSIIHGDLHLIK